MAPQQLPDEAFVESFNFWRRYRDEPEATAEQLLTDYRTFDFEPINYPAVNPNPVFLYFPDRISEPIDGPDNPDDPAIQRFIASRPPTSEFPGSEEQALFKGVKYLGPGGNSIAGV